MVFDVCRLRGVRRVRQDAHADSSGSLASTRISRASCPSTTVNCRGGEGAKKPVKKVAKKAAKKPQERRKRNAPQEGREEAVSNQGQVVNSRSLKHPSSAVTTG